MSQVKLYKTFNVGIDSDEDMADQGFLATIQGVDIHGVGGGTAAAHKKRSYQPSQLMSPQAQAAGPNNITGLVNWVYPFNGKTYAFDAGARIYEAGTSFGGTWTLKFTALATSQGGGMLPFGVNLYYGQDGYLGKFDGTTNTNTFKTLNDQTGNPRPMAIIAGRLAIGDGRNIATLESDETTFNATRLQLPIGYVVRSLETWNNYLAIAADFAPPSTGTPILSRLFLWNGTTATYSDAIELPFTSAPMLVSLNNNLWIIGGDTVNNLFIYVYNGLALHRAFFIPGIVPTGLGSRTKFQGNILFGASGRTNSLNGGVWMIGGGQEGEPFALSMPFLLSPGAGVTGTNVGGLYATKNNLLAAWYDGSVWGIDANVAAQFPTSGPIIQTLPLHMGEPDRNKVFYNLRVDLIDPGTSTGATFVISYKKNLASSWTSLKTINQSDSSLSYIIPLGFIARRVEFQFQWTVTSTNNPLQLRSFQVEYDLAPTTY